MECTAKVLNPVAGATTSIVVQCSIPGGFPAETVFDVFVPIQFQVRSDKIGGQRGLDGNLVVRNVQTAEEDEGTVVSISTADVASGEVDLAFEKGSRSTLGQLVGDGDRCTFVLNKITNPPKSGEVPPCRIKAIYPEIVEVEDENDPEYRRAKEERDAVGSDDDEKEIPTDSLVPPRVREYTGRTITSEATSASVNKLQPGDLTGGKVTHANVVVSTESSVNVVFRTTNPVPVGGSICVRFDPSFVSVAPTTDTTRLVRGIDASSGDLVVSVREDERTVDVKIVKTPTDDVRVGSAPMSVMCAANTLVELEFSNGITNPKTPGVRSQGGRENRTYRVWTIAKDGGMIDETTSVPATKFTTSVSPEEVRSFLFPKHLCHPKSTGRLTILQRYGPLDDQGRLRGGKYGSHVVSEAELKCMVKEVYVDDLMRVYTDQPETLTSRQREDIAKSASRRVRDAIYRNITMEELNEILTAVPKNSVGGMDFADLQRAIESFRQRRTKMCRDPSTEYARPKASRNASGKFDRRRNIPASRTRFIGQGVKMHELEINDIKHQMLHTETCRICEIGEGDNPELTQNVALLRRDDPSRDVSRTIWSNSTSTGRRDLSYDAIQRQFPKTHLKLVRVKRLPPPRPKDLYDDGVRRARETRREAKARTRDAFDRRRAVPF